MSDFRMGAAEARFADIIWEAEQEIGCYLQAANYFDVGTDTIVHSILVDIESSSRWGEGFSDLMIACEHERKMRYMDSAVMMDGTLRVHHEKTDEFDHLRIENHSVRYTHYQDVRILSPFDAYQKLLLGDFEYAAALNHDAKGTVSILSCTLDYEIDTKGFYQPVYIFEILIPESLHRCPRGFLLH